MQHPSENIDTTGDEIRVRRPEGLDDLQWAALRAELTRGLDQLVQEATGRGPDTPRPSGS